MRQELWRLLALLLVVGVLAAACGSTTDAVISGESETTDDTSELAAQSISLPLSAPIHEGDIVQARIQLDVARQVWASAQPFAHTLTLGDQVEWALEIDFDENGNVIEERVLSSETAQFVPGRSVDEVFDGIDEAITDFETGVLDVPAPEECGNHFNAWFDDELGTPVYFDRLGPCDDGIGFRFQVTPLAE